MQQRVTTTWITGASGLVGRSLVRAAVAAGHDVIASDVRIGARPLPSDDRVEWVTADVRDPTSLRRAAHGRGIDALIHAAAVTTGTKMETFETNIVGTSNILERAVESTIPRVVFLSSGAVYGVTGADRAIDESCSLSGDNGYASSKIAGELLCRREAERSGAVVTCCRLGTLYGPDERTSPYRSRISTPSQLAIWSHKQQPSKVAGLRYRRPYTHVDDAASAVLALTVRFDLEETIFNVDCGVRLCFEELLEAACHAWPDFTWQRTDDENDADVALRPEDERPRLDGSRLERAVGPISWRSMEDGLRSYRQ